MNKQGKETTHTHTHHLGKKRKYKRKLGKMNDEREKK